MKIAHITAVFPPDKGGMGNAAYRLAREGARAGHDVTVFTPLYTEEQKDFTCDDIRVVRMRPLLKYGKSACVPQLLTLLKDFDLLHLHYPFFGGAEWVWAAVRFLRRTRLVISYHMDVIGTGPRALVYKFYTDLLLGRILSCADAVVVSSLDYAEHSLVRKLAPQARTVAIPYGVDSRFIPGQKNSALMSRWGIQQGEVVILFVGGFEYFKGIECLIRSVPRLRGEFKVLLVGGGDLLPSSIALANELGLSDKVKFAGSAADSELADYYNLCDIFILPSTDRTEAFGIVLIEAMACGKPVIASNLPGVRTVVEDGGNGYLTAPGDVNDIAAKLQLLIDREDLRAELGRKGREKVANQYVWEKVGDLLRELYQILVPVPENEISRRTMP